MVVTPPAEKAIPSRTVAPSKLDTPPVVTSPRKVAVPADTNWSTLFTVTVDSNVLVPVLER